MNFKSNLLQAKQISVWGVGYLGYTVLLKLHSLGFKTIVYDFNPEQLRRLRSGKYPTQEQKSLWSKTMDIPHVSYDLTQIAEVPDQMFDSACHIIGFPSEGTLIESLVSAFVKNRSRIDERSIVVFLAAETPGNIDRHFISNLKKAGVECSVAAAFRSDWTIEEFFRNQVKQVLAANDRESLDKAVALYELLDYKYGVLSSIKEAEIYENALKSLRYMIGEYVNQLALAYPRTNIRAMTKLLVENVNASEMKFRIGAEDYKTVVSIEHLLNGAKRPQYLSLIQESQSSSLTLLGSYADMILSHNVSSVLVLGLSAVGDQKDHRFSPSVFIAEYFHQKGITVFLHDPFFSSKEIREIMPFAQPTELGEASVCQDAVVVMTDHSHYKVFSQKDIDAIGISKVKIVVDNAGVFKNYSFQCPTNYHLVGDGSFGWSKNELSCAE